MFKMYLIIYVVEPKNADGIDVLLSSSRAPPPIVTGSNSWKSITHWIFSTRHSLLLLWKKIILPNLKKLMKQFQFEVLQKNYIETI